MFRSWPKPIKTIWLVPIVFFLCVNTTPAKTEPSRAYKLRARKFYLTVKPYVGRVKYAWGGTSVSSGMDCSAFVRFIVAKFGVRLPRTSREQVRFGRRISVDRLRPGDLLFFDTNRRRRGIDHVGLYLGYGYFVHASSPQGVRIQKINQYKFNVNVAKRVL